MTITIETCFCSNQLSFEQCCKPIIDGEVDAKNAETLMRSRFTAYVIKDYQYILQTYASTQRTKLSVNDLADNTQNIQWLSLQVLAHHPQENIAQVEFKAFYKISKTYYVMHELSDFVLEANKWLYTTGEMQRDSGEFIPKRNDLCLCASGKKFKKCCGK